MNGLAILCVKRTSRRDVESVFLAKVCSYCKFSAICQFDSTVKGNKYENINKKTDEEALELIYKAVSDRLLIEAKGGNDDGRN